MPRFSRTTNKDETHTVYVDGKKAFRGSPLSADAFISSWRPAATEPTTGTTAKISSSHDRMTMNVVFANGDKLRLTLSRGGISCSSRQPAANPVITKADLAKVLKLTDWIEGTDKTNMDRFDRVSAALCKVATIHAL